MPVLMIYSSRQKKARRKNEEWEHRKKDIEILDWLYQMDRKTLGEDICEGGHRFPKGKYDFCPICLRKFKAESEDEE